MASFDIRLVFPSPWPAGARAALEEAVHLWLGVVKDPLPAMKLKTGEVVLDLRVTAQIVQGSAGGDFARAGPDEIRPKEAGPAAYLPATGILALDDGDVDMLLNDRRLARVLAHELGHVLGIGYIWPDKSLLKGAGTKDVRFSGACAMREHGTLLRGAPAPVPVENLGSASAVDQHWRESVFGNELMSSYVRDSVNPLSRLTVASLEDLGYGVSYAGAEKYALPKAGFQAPALMPNPPDYSVRATKPTVLPPEAIISHFVGERR